MVNSNGHTEGPPSKKRRVDGGQGNASAQSSDAGVLIFEARDISFSLPQRKKLHLGLIEHSSSTGGGKAFSIQLRNPGNNQVESTHRLESYSHFLRLPVPEKNQKQYNFCLIPTAQDTGSTEPIIWTINDGPLKSYKIDSDDLQAVASGPNHVLEDTLNYALDPPGNKLVLPNGDEFTSAIRESHRKGDLTYHVKAFRGSKEGRQNPVPHLTSTNQLGYLFFLENGVFFGFKKPLMFFSFDDIESVSYTSVLQRTFNLNITARTTSDSTTQEIEFSMLDQQDFGGIDDYIKRHQLQDASLAEARKAKKAGKAAKTAEVGENGDQTELEKAQAEMEDEEDELEEDYDPEEDEDNSDSGSESGEEEYTAEKGRNLIAEELGSEAEDVSVSEDDDDEEEPDEMVEDIPKKPPVKQQKPTNIPTHSVRPNTVAPPPLDDEDQL